MILVESTPPFRFNVAQGIYSKIWRVLLRLATMVSTDTTFDVPPMTRGIDDCEKVWGALDNCIARTPTPNVGRLPQSLPDNALQALFHKKTKSDISPINGWWGEDALHARKGLQDMIMSHLGQPLSSGACLATVPGAVVKPDVGAEELADSANARR
ncbi:hypothetical protein BDK51DRAFT_28021 [Blyttiomyces helicus]|uniref:Uncharacterized protein n=1 Tax=Blyttiomyces helicus TaxID=388810 RepID=A0A4P9WML5_9FUNG|nr:hypothetical protein BDK51DRAFT_28021 [Blyttiomyces helicus]|eukprot:RKO94321.1 hypothetical protein BDK51DRAFT_28021 [Blyttiomyces helicus]